MGIEEEGGLSNENIELLLKDGNVRNLGFI